MEDDDLRDLFAGLGSITIRRMFGGKGVYHDGLIVAVVLRGELLMKGDAETAGAIEAAGGKHWIYKNKKGHDVAMPYWTVPEGALDDADEMTVWGRMAYAAALRFQGADKPKAKAKAKARIKA